MVLNVLPQIISLLKVDNPTTILEFLQTSGYLIMFVIMILEGPIITYVASFAASLDIFNVFYVAILSFLGNVLGDLICFFIGRAGKKLVVKRFVVKTIGKGRMNFLMEYLRKNPGKAITIVKLTPPLPVPGLILSGTSDMSLRKFIFYSSVVSAIYTVFLVFLGFYSGVAFEMIATYVKYIGYLIGGTILIIILVFLIVKFISKRVSNKIEEI